MAVVVSPAQAIPQSSEGFYSINNQFQESGPKGIAELKILENGELFWRIDLPGVPKERVTFSLHPSKKCVLIYAFAPSLDVRYSLPRRYDLSCKITCKCCEISSFVSDVSEGVLRLVASTTLITSGAKCPYKFPQRSNRNAPVVTGPELQPHPCVKEGPTMAYESTPFGKGGLYVRVDMPGVPKASFTVSVTNGRVKVSGQAPALSHDSAGRFYSGDVAVFSAPVEFPLDWITSYANFGVIRLHICSPL